MQTLFSIADASTVSPTEFIQQLRGLLDERGLLHEAADLEPFSADWRGLFSGSPLCVALPRSAEEVSAVIRACASAGYAVVPSGGNTGLSGGATPDKSGRQVVLSLARMNAIRRIDVYGETIEVEAGCILQTAQEAAAAQGLLLPVTLASQGSAQIGGIVSTNAGGTNVLRYGMARSRILGLEVVTADGEIVRGLRSLRKDNAGYDWKQWFIGTEGTLGIVTCAVLQLAPMPRHRVTALLAVQSATAALEVLRTARQDIGDALNAFELMSREALELVVRHKQLRLPVADAPWFVLIEASSSLQGLRETTEAVLMAAIERGDASDAAIAESQRQEAELWALRESISEAEGKEGPSIKHDVSVPVSRIPDFLAAADEAIQRKFPGIRINAFGHAGDGNIHYNLIAPAGSDHAAVNRTVHDLVMAHGGSISAEHGIGQYRVDELVRCKSAEETALTGRIKSALDPSNMLNPGKVLRPRHS
ncbi:FAD-binding oxidoreductase [Hydrogenophaga sp.]|uniref:FAD-binding oxidoreductase n=1 Tax=Hydrogenophaga sp. TaxID=1904254 RepID=UPI002722C097|nr:FAD-binding oxidoreductase [Hydrogenophaga sp.]MDO9436694.1 FAD-binding oxidoreductase [Hydrogenophaga sp.]